MVAQARDAYVEGVPPEMRSPFWTVFDGLSLPTTLPAYAEILTERNGTVWVRGYEVPGAARQWWARFDSAGMLLGTLVIPPGLRVERFSNGYVILRHFDATSSNGLLVYRIEAGG
jgi:hypothetical protein